MRLLGKSVAFDGICIAQLAAVGHGAHSHAVAYIQQCAEICVGNADHVVVIGAVELNEVAGVAVQNRTADIGDSIHAPS